MSASSSTARSSASRMMTGTSGRLQELRRAPAAFAGDQFKKSVALADDERLDDALFADGIGQFAQRLVGKFLARLERGRADAVQRHAQHAFAIVRRGRRRDDCDDGLDGRRGRRTDVSGGLPPSNAPRPRPNAGFAMRAECRRAGKLSI